MPVMIVQASNLSRYFRKAEQVSFLVIKIISHFSIIRKLAKDAFHSCIQITDKTIEQDWP